ncbi:MAG: CPBP family intramembrane metalloprotease [Bacteroidetes bacterium]|nr:CPBP family intramembrane metalloprotease [Bacteroidota bacterium]
MRLHYAAETPLWVFLVAGTVRLFPAILVLYISAKYFDRRKIRDFGLTINKSWMLDLLFGFCLAGLLMSIVFISALSLGWITVSETFHTSHSLLPFLAPFLVFVVYNVCVGAFEELLTRGYLIRNLSEGFNSKRIKPRLSILGSWIFISVMFGLGHLANPNANIVGFINLVLIGLTFGIGYILTGELAIPIGLHIGWNFFMGNVFGFPVSGFKYFSDSVSLVQISQNGPDIWTGGKFGPEARLLGLFANILGLILIFLWIYNRRKEGFGQFHLPLADYPILNKFN